MTAVGSNYPPPPALQPALIRAGGRGLPWGAKAQL